jgi:fructose-1,6-bisphosphatase/inositol monophosphatase family enzyme
VTVTQYKEELVVAEKAAREAGSVVMDLFKGKFDIHEKSKNNPVTTADLEANRIIREKIQTAFPGDGWLSEEDQDNRDRLARSRIWIVDPIDGTKEFIEGVSEFAISIAFVVEGRPQIAIVHNPAEQRFYKAASGAGAYMNDQPIRIASREQVDGALLLDSRSARSHRKGFKFLSIIAVSNGWAVSPIASPKSPRGTAMPRLPSAIFMNGTSAPVCSWSKKPVALRWMGRVTQ